MGCGFPQRHKCTLCSIYDPKPMCANNELSHETNRLRKRTIKTQVTLGWRVPLVYWFKVELQNRHTCVNIDIIKGMIKCVLWNTSVHSDINCGRLTVWSKVTVLSTPLKKKKQPPSDGGLGEGHSEVMVLSQVVIVKFDQRLNCFLHRAQLDESHFTIFPERINTIF